MNPISFSHVFPAGPRIDLRLEAGAVRVRFDGEPVLSGRLQTPEGGAPAVACLDWPEVQVEPFWLGAALAGLFEAMPGLDRVEWAADGPHALVEALCRHGFALKPETPGAAIACPRGWVRQRAELWLAQPRETVFPLRYAMSGGKRHPLRPPIQPGEVYRRPIPALGSLLSLRTLDPERDLDTFHRWMNTPRVAHFWELEGGLEDHRRYLDKVLADAHMHPVLGCFDGEPFGYFELYWAKEDRIAPYYGVDDYDRGLHMLVGEERFRGPHRVAAWLPSLAHYLFLDDPRTHNVVAEPRADNAKMIGYLQQAGFHKAKEFDFPHKRAALMVLPREVFFDPFCP
ncbi:GNAT family N-acetyltransferase [Methylomagnum ishizawai]|uniref:GNAT family N-acetyltransferase n=1 Tax=Methylomagnum ishizawai TaxID=1760988 RepID=UPI001C33DD81|nr:GNAT family N-acetyltransferase [Methylomagnum ishizawai]BBL77213.1 N(6)-hydroxylysine O-acetyltransferase [Methylomagnum ishizawai]